MSSPSQLPRLTIITVCLNAEDTLLRTLSSVGEQLYPNIEYILCDGGSTDRTEMVYETWKAALPVDVVLGKANIKCVHWFRQGSFGIYAAMNEAMALASGEVVVFLHANDAFANEAVCDNAMGALRSLGELDAVYGDVCVDAQQWWKRRYIASRWWRPWMLNWGFMSPQPGFFVRTSALKKVGPFVETMQIGGDFEWMLRFYRIYRLRAQWRMGICINMLGGGVSMRGRQSRSVIAAEMRQALYMHGFKVRSWQLWLRLPFKGFGILRALWR